MNDSQRSRVRIKEMQRAQIARLITAVKDSEKYIQTDAKRISALEKAASGGSTPETAKRK